MSTAVARVFEIYELVERIICFVPPEHIFNLHRVCRHIREVVLDSERIQRHHCLSSITEDDYKVVPVYKFSPIRPVWSLHMAYPPDYQRDGHRILEISDTPVDTEPFIRTINIELKHIKRIPETRWQKIAGQSVFTPRLRGALFQVSSLLPVDTPPDLEKAWIISEEGGITIGTMKGLFEQHMKRFPDVDPDSMCCTVSVDVQCPPETIEPWTSDMYGPVRSDVRRIKDRTII